MCVSILLIDLCLVTLTWKDSAYFYKILSKQTERICNSGCRSKSEAEKYGNLVEKAVENVYRNN